MSSDGTGERDAPQGRPPRHAVSLQARLMLTVFGLVSLIFIVVAAITSVMLNSSLEDRLTEQVRNMVAESQEWLAHSPAIDPAGSLAEAQMPPGTILVFETRGGVRSGAVVDAHHTIQSLSESQLRGLSLGERTMPEQDLPATVAAVSTLTVPRLGEFRVLHGEILGGYAIMGQSTTDVRSTIGQMLTIITFTTAAGLFVLGAATTLVIRQGLKPLRAVAETAQRVARQPLDQGVVSIEERVPVEQADPRTETGRVGAALNTLLDHVDASLHARQRNEERMRRFVADASHELRTPLASIRGYSELSLRDPSLTETTGQSLERIQAQSIRMTGLVEDLLLLARLDEGQELVYGAVDLTQLVLESVADQRVTGPDHIWRMDVDEDPVIVAGDAARLNQVILNLLANARTHTPAGTTVTVSVGHEGTGSATRGVVKVHDDGPGIDPALQAELFTRFARGDRSRARATGGTGLGMAIVKAIVEAHHGTITVRSAPGDTTFEVSLPAKPRDPA
ncbi:HAMP domain-containing sensor histidine kinase [Microbacterium paludicola]